MITPLLIVKEVGKMFVEHWVRTTIVLVVLVGTYYNTASADELIMADDPKCGYCIRFMAEVVPTYNESELGKAFPLTIIDVTDPASKTTYAWFVTALEQNRRTRIGGTPTFFVWKGDRETGESIGAIVGYPGKVPFYIHLDAIVKVTN